MDWTSCECFLANQFRVLRTVAAYVLFQELRRRAAGTTCADAQVTTLRERLLRLAVWVERSRPTKTALSSPRARPPLPSSTSRGHQAMRGALVAVVTVRS